MHDDGVNGSQRKNPDSTKQSYGESADSEEHLARGGGAQGDQSNPTGARQRGKDGGEGQHPSDGNADRTKQGGETGSKPERVLQEPEWQCKRTRKKRSGKKRGWKLICAVLAVLSAFVGYAVRDTAWFQEGTRMAGEFAEELPCRFPLVEKLCDAHWKSAAGGDIECSLVWFQNLPSFRARLREFSRCDASADKDIKYMMVREGMGNDDGALVFKLAQYLDPNLPHLILEEGPHATDIKAAVQLYGRASDMGVAGASEALRVTCESLDRNDFLSERLFEARCDVSRVGIVQRLDRHSLRLGRDAELKALDSSVVGATTTWSNPENWGGTARGSVTIIRDGQNQGGSVCREYSHEMMVIGKASAETKIPCQGTDGQWTAIDGSVVSELRNVPEKIKSEGVVFVSQGENCEYNAALMSAGSTIVRTASLECSPKPTEGLLILGCLQLGGDFSGGMFTAIFGESTRIYVGSKTTREISSTWSGFKDIVHSALATGIVEEEKADIPVQIEISNGSSETHSWKSDDGTYDPNPNIPYDEWSWNGVRQLEYQWAIGSGQGSDEHPSIVLDLTKSHYRSESEDIVFRRVMNAIVDGVAIGWKFHQYDGMLAPTAKDPKVARRFKAACDAGRNKRW